MINSIHTQLNLYMCVFIVSPAARRKSVQRGSSLKLAWASAFKKNIIEGINNITSTLDEPLIKSRESPKAAIPELPNTTSPVSAKSTDSINDTEVLYTI